MRRDDEFMCDHSICPDSCTCLDGSYDCSRARLTYLPATTPDVIALIVSYNHLVNISMITCEQMYKFDVSYNNIQSLGLQTFINCVKLHFLDLSRNNIRHISRGHFIRLNYLVLFNISHNPLVSIGEQSFKGLYLVRRFSIQFSDNKLVTLPDCIFSDMLHLTQLTLVSGTIREFDDNTLCKLAHLEKLIIQNSTIYYNNWQPFPYNSRFD